MKGVHITLRMRLFCEIFRDGEPIEGQQYEVLNEVVVDRGANPFLTKIECFEKGRLITKVGFRFHELFRPHPLCENTAKLQGDGLTSADPTGSNACLLAADMLGRKRSRCDAICCAEGVMLAAPTGSTAHLVAADMPCTPVAVCFAGASRRPHAGHPNRQHCLLGGSWRLHGAPQCASNPLHTSLRTLAVLQVGGVPWCRRALPLFLFPCVRNPSALHVGAPPAKLTIPAPSHSHSCSLHVGCTSVALACPACLAINCLDWVLLTLF